MPSPSQLSFVGIAKQPTSTPVAATNFVAVKTITPEDVVKYLPVEVFKGSMPEVYGQVQGFKNTTFEYAGPVFADTIPWSLFGVLGDVSFTASRSVTDGVTTSGSPNVSSATASFTSADLGKTIGNANIPSGAVIQTVTSGTAVVMSQNATNTSSGQTFVIGPTSWHVANVLNSGTAQPTANTLLDFYGLTGGTPARQYAGHQWHEVQIKFTPDGLLEHVSKGTGLVPSLPVAKPAQSFTSVTPTPSWTGIATIGGSVVSTVIDGDVTITRKVDLPPGLTGTQQYTAVWIGGITVKVKLNFMVNDDTELTRMLTNASPSVDLNFTQGAGLTAQQLVLHMTNLDYLKAKPNRGKSYVVYDVDAEAHGNITDIGASGGFGIITAKAGNAVASGTYQ